MDTMFKSGIIMIAVLITAGQLLAEDSANSNMLDNEKNLVSGVSADVEQAPEDQGILSNLNFGGDDNKVEKDLPVVPTDVAEEQGFWTQFKGAFTKNAAPMKVDNKRKIEVDVLMIDGREYYRKGNFDKALESFKEVIQRDPYNITAQRYIRDSQEQLMKITMDDYEISRQDRLQDVAKSWLLKPARDREIEKAIGVNIDAKSGIEADIQQLMPLVEFSDNKLETVFDALYQDSNPKVSIIANSKALKQLADDGKDQITLKLKNVPLIEVIKYVCSDKGLVYRVDASAIVISGKESVKLESKVFQLSRPLTAIEFDEEVRTATDRAKLLLKKIGVPEVEGASISFISKSNQLRVRNTDANLKIIEDFFEKFDKTPFQVQIESRFVTVNNDKMSQLVFRHFLTKNYRWDHGKKGDKYYLEAPNAERELTPGLRYIRSFMDDTSFNPVESAYSNPSLVSTGNDYVDYMRGQALKPNQPDYLAKSTEDIDTIHSTIEQLNAAVGAQRDTVQARYKTYQNALTAYTPAIAAGAPNAAAYQAEVTSLYSGYQSALTNGTTGLLTSMANLDYEMNNLRQAEAVETSVNDGIGKIADISGVLGPAQYRSVIYALDNSDGVDTIFAPKLTVLNGQRGEIKDVIRIRYNTTIEEAEDQDIDVGDSYSVVYDYAVSPKNWETREYGTKLTVTPSVQKDERTIELDLNPEISDLDGFRQFVSSRQNEYKLPQFFVQSLKTVVTVNDGDTLVMGGLISESVVKTKDKTPFLGDLPLIGRFWRGESEVAKKSNLMVFITAKILDPSGKSRRRSNVATR